MITSMILLLSMADLVAALLDGNRRALARVLTRVEQGSAASELAQLYPHTGKAWVIGITGAPGTGKSSLVTALAKHLRAQDQTLAIVAVDPTSPFSGGAILGDRIRMRDLAGDAGVFIRSMATRGNLGGLAHATHDMVRVLDAAGFDYVLIETVGAGQSEVEVARLAYTTLVVEAPGLGDDVQAIKAGILEIADILVVNKADRAGAAQSVRTLRAMLELGHSTNTLHHGHILTPEAHLQASLMWQPLVVQTVATAGVGISELGDAIAKHRTYCTMTGSDRLRDDAIRQELFARLQQTFLQQFLASDTVAGQVSDAIERIRRRQQDPQTAVDGLLAAFYTSDRQGASDGG